MDAITQRRHQCQQARELKRGQMAHEATPAEWDEEEARENAAQNKRDDFREDRQCYDELVERLSGDVNFLDALHRLCNEPDVQAKDIAEIREAVNAECIAMARDWLDTPEMI